MLLSQQLLPVLALTVSPSLDAQVTEEDTKAFLQFAAAIESAMEDGDPAPLDAAIDIHRLAERIRMPLLENAAFNEWIEEFLVVFEDSFGFGEEIVESLEESDESYCFLRMMPANPSHALFRWAGDNGLVYHMFALERDEDGAVRIVDMFAVGTGRWWSEEFREGIVEQIALSDRSSAEELLGDSLESIDTLLTVREMVDAVSDDPVFALELYDELPEATQGRLRVQNLRINAAMAPEIDNATYLAVLNDFARLHPECTAVPMMMLGAHVLVEDFDAAREDIAKLEKIVHGDAYLDVVRAQLLIGEERYEPAKELLDRAMEADSSVRVPAMWELLDISIAEENHRETLRALDWLYEKARWCVGDTTSLEGYEAFNASAWGRRWLRKMEEAGELDD